MKKIILLIMLLVLCVGCKKKEPIVFEECDPNTADIIWTIPGGDSFNEPNYLCAMIAGKIDDLQISFYYRCPCGNLLEVQSPMPDNMASLTCAKCFKHICILVFVRDHKGDEK